MVFLRQLTFNRSPQTDRQKYGADNNVEPMETSRHEESRTEHTALDRKIGMVILKCLAAREAKAKSNS